MNIEDRIRFLEHSVWKLEARVSVLEQQHVPNPEPPGTELIAITEQSPSSIDGTSTEDQQ